MFGPMYEDIVICKGGLEGRGQKILFALQGDEIKLGKI